MCEPCKNDCFAKDMEAMSSKLESTQKAMALTELQMNLECDGRVAAEKELQVAKLQNDVLRKALDKIAMARLGGCSTGEAMSKAEAWARDALAAVAETRNSAPEHLYQGDCPFGNDTEARDPECPACLAMGVPNKRNDLSPGFEQACLRCLGAGKFPVVVGAPPETCVNCNGTGKA